MEDALQSLPSSASGKGGKGKAHSARRLIIDAIDLVDVYEKISKASQASKELGCDDPQDQDEGTCELLSFALSALVFESSVPSGDVTSLQVNKDSSNTMSNNSSGKGKENLSSMTEVWEESTSDWSLDYKQKAFISTLTLAGIILKEMLDDDDADELN